MARKLEVEIIGDASSLERAFGRAAGSTNTFGEKLKSFGKAALIAGAAAAGLGLVLGKKMADAAIQAQEANDKLTVALKNQGIQLQATSPQILALEKSGRQLGFTNEEMRAGFTKLINSGKSYAVSAREIGVAQDLSRVSGQSLADSATALIRLQTGQTRAAKQYGIVLPPVTAAVDALKASHIDLTTAAGKAAKAQATVQDKLATGQAYYQALTEKIKGQGQAFAGTAAGGMARFHAALSNLEEVLGAKLLPIIASVATRLSGFVTALSGAGSASDKFHAALMALGLSSSQASSAVQGFERALGIIKAVLGEVWGVLRQVGGFLSGSFGQGFAIAAALVYVLTRAFLVARDALVAMRVAMVAVAANPLGLALAAVGVAAAAVLGHFIQGQVEAHNLAAALTAGAAAAYAFKAAYDTLSGSTLDLQTSQANVTSTLHAAQAAQQTYNGFVNAGTQATLAGKQAHDSSISSWLAHKQAVQQLTSATTAHEAAEKKANQTTRDALQPLLAFNASVDKNIRSHQAAIPILGGVSNAVNKLTFGIVGASKSTAADEVAVRKWGEAMVVAGQHAVTTAINTEKMSPAARSAQQAVGLMTEAAGNFARRTGTVPKAISDITLEAAKLKPTQFQAAMSAWIASAKSAGVEIPKWVKTGLAQANTEVASQTTLIKASMATLPAAATAAGRGLSTGLAAGINGSAAIAKAQAVVATIKAIMSTKFGSTPLEWGAARGRELIEGFAQGIVQSQGVATTAADKAKQLVKARLTAADVLAAVRAAGQTIGLEHALAIARGILQGAPGIVAQVRQALQQGIEAARQAVVDARGAFASAFATLAQQALAAFDAKWAGWVPPSQKLLDKMQLRDQLNQLTADLGTAVQAAEMKLAAAFASGNKAAIAQAQGDLNTALAASQAAIVANAQSAVTAAQAALTAAQAEGDPEKIAAAQAALDTALANQKTAVGKGLADQRALVEENLTLRAAAEQRTHDAIIAKQREGLARKLVALQKALLDDPKAWDKMGADVQRILASYHVPFVTAGTKWATDFADGIRKGIPAAVQAAKDLAAAVDKYMPHSPAKTGPLAYDVEDVGRQWAQGFARGLAGGSVGGAAAGVAAMGVGGGVGGVNITVNVHGPLVGSGGMDELATTIRRKLEKTNLINGYVQGARV
jgi:hypothetical protein